jgi:hypothetical protein
MGFVSIVDMPRSSHPRRLCLARKSRDRASFGGDMLLAEPRDVRRATTWHRSRSARPTETCGIPWSIAHRPSAKRKPSQYVDSSVWRSKESCFSACTMVRTSTCRRSRRLRTDGSVTPNEAADWLTLSPAEQRSTTDPRCISVSLPTVRGAKPRRRGTPDHVFLLGGRESDGGSGHVIAMSTNLERCN